MILVNLLTRMVWALSLLAGATVAAAAAEDPAGRELAVTVRPSGFESPVAQEARERQERLVRRLDDSEYAFRNICNGCNRSTKRLIGINAPFYPMAVLGGRDGAGAD
jgi:hypothetical protein